MLCPAAKRVRRVERCGVVWGVWGLGFRLHRRMHVRVERQRKREIRVRAFVVGLLGGLSERVEREREGVLAAARRACCGLLQLVAACCVADPFGPDAREERDSARGERESSVLPHTREREGERGSACARKGTGPMEPLVNTSDLADDHRKSLRSASVRRPSVPWAPSRAMILEHT